MVCFKPNQLLSTVQPDGTKYLKFLGAKSKMIKYDYGSDDPFEAFTPSSVEVPCLNLSEYITIPCGQCVGCRLDKSREWAIRCMHEASLYDDGCFITLTYSNQFMPKYGTLVKEDFQNFMKRLRKKYGKGLRYYYAGEYGDSLGRPHYHCLLFNLDFEDKRFLKMTKLGHRLYTSDSLSALWPFGHHWIGSITFQSAGYIARYCLKKITGPSSAFHYRVYDERLRQYATRQPEYTDMSRMSGVGKGWYGVYKSDLYPSDNVVVKGREYKIPRYYDKLFEIEYPDDYKSVKEARVERASKLNLSDQTPERLLDREKCKKASISKLIREYEAC